LSHGPDAPPDAPPSAPPDSAPERHPLLITPAPADWGDELDISLALYAGLSDRRPLAPRSQTFVFAFHSVDAERFLRRAPLARDAQDPRAAQAPRPTSAVPGLEPFAQLVTLTTEPPPGRRKPPADEPPSPRVVYVQRVRLLAVEEGPRGIRLATVEEARVNDDRVDLGALRDKRKALGAQLLAQLNEREERREEISPELKRLAEEAAGRRPFLKWSHELLEALKPDEVARVLWAQCGTSLERIALLHALALEHVSTLGALGEVQRNLSDLFSLNLQRANLRRRLTQLSMVLRTVERRHAALAEGGEGGEGAGRDARDPRDPRARFFERLGAEREPPKDPWGEEEEGEPKTIEERLGALSLPIEARREVRRALKALRGGAGMGPEAHTLKGFLELVCELPWEKRAEERALSLDEVAAALDARHEGLAEVKERVLEHLAVTRLSGRPQGTVLCLSGPPGVGKTTLVREVAAALGRPFVRVSLGGVHDEADIRGHRRTYVASVPGRICDALRLAKVKNPVLLLDELDKLGEGRRGSPEAALLEVLDPEQNRAFRDHYLEIPLDLSEVLFICTVNDPRALSAPLRDRLELVELSGYTDAEKHSITRAHLLPHALSRHGLPAGALTLSGEVLTELIARYTKEAGVRQLERAVARLCRKLALRAARAPAGALPPTLAPAVGDLVALLGPPKHARERAVPLLAPGVVNGLAWTAVGGAVLHIEAARYKGKGALRLTGRLGEVMQESAQAALTALRVRRGEELASLHDFDALDVHVHLPDGAVPKDGPSAGVALYCVLYSLMSGRALREDVAMTGECTLQGRVLAVGGLREKLLGAQREGMRRVIMPRSNQEEVMAFEPEARGALELVWVDLVEQALAAALPGAPAALGPSGEGAQELQAQGGAVLSAADGANQQGGGLTAQQVVVHEV